MRHSFMRDRSIEYECGNAREMRGWVPDRCPNCGAEIASAEVT